MVDAKGRRSPSKKETLRHEEPSVLALTSKWNTEMVLYPIFRVQKGLVHPPGPIDSSACCGSGDGCLPRSGQEYLQHVEEGTPPADEEHRRCPGRDSTEE